MIYAVLPIPRTEPPKAVKEPTQRKIVSLLHSNIYSSSAYVLTCSVKMKFWGPATVAASIDFLDIRLSA